ncbi:hypothetical protein Dsin_022677 [Dipteronia sinensis]|uniref:Uncharacterized protein n=1 Tax=Dipteronia sinensis TaxID=43782 RepID=A0AAE0A2U7_9ROSI|nr:hypothetical protein Dsin_022677 [Dipteronia sinensis]
MFALLKPTFSLPLRPPPLARVLPSKAERSPTDAFLHPTASADRLAPFIFGARALDQQSAQQISLNSNITAEEIGADVTRACLNFFRSGFIVNLVHLCCESDSLRSGGLWSSDKAFSSLPRAPSPPSLVCRFPPNPTEGIVERFPPNPLGGNVSAVGTFSASSFRRFVLKQKPERRSGEQLGIEEITKGTVNSMYGRYPLSKDLCVKYTYTFLSGFGLREAERTAEAPIMNLDTEEESLENVRSSKKGAPSAWSNSSDATLPARTFWIVIFLAGSVRRDKRKMLSISQKLIPTPMLPRSAYRGIEREDRGPEQVGLGYRAVSAVGGGDRGRARTDWNCVELGFQTLHKFSVDKRPKAAAAKDDDDDDVGSMVDLQFGP